MLDEKKWKPRPESNWNFRFRRPWFYPLNYEAIIVVASSGIKPEILLS